MGCGIIQWLQFIKALSSTLKDNCLPHYLLSAGVVGVWRINYKHSLVIKSTEIISVYSQYKLNRQGQCHIVVNYWSSVCHWQQRKFVFEQNLSFLFAFSDYHHTHNVVMFKLEKKKKHGLSYQYVFISLETRTTIYCSIWWFSRVQQSTNGPESKLHFTI